MITQKTSEKIWQAHREIAASNRMLEDLAKVELESDRQRREVNPKDAFRSERPYQLGAPSGENSHRIFNVRPALAASVILAHIADQERDLVEANEQARIELQQGNLV